MLGVKVLVNSELNFHIFFLYGVITVGFRVENICKITLELVIRCLVLHLIQFLILNTTRALKILAEQFSI